MDLSSEEDCSKRNLLVDPDTAKRFLFDVFDLYDSIEAIRIEEDGETLGLNDICVRPAENGSCQVRNFSLVSMLDL